MATSENVTDEVSKEYIENQRPAESDDSFEVETTRQTSGAERSAMCG